MTTVLLTGILAAFAAVTLAAGLRRAPVRMRCPSCGAATTPVQPHPMVQRAVPELRVRWCPSCSWQGVAGDAPFRWGEERFPQDFGFRFADEPPPYLGTTAEPPAHPSGFRFAALDEGEAEAPPEVVHPSGFSWAGQPSGTTADAPEAPLVFRWGQSGHPAGFQWKDRPVSQVPVFRWKD